MTRRPRRSWGKIRKLPSGRYQASYTGPDLGRHQAPATFTSRMDAEHWLADERRLIERDEWTPPKLRAAAKHGRSQTLGQYADRWLETRDLKPRTRQGYRELLDGPLAKMTKVPLHLITPETVRTWHAGMGTATPTKRAHAYQVLRAVLNTAVSDGLIITNPCTIRGAGVTKAKREAANLSVDQIAKIANAITPDRFKALVLISAWCGLRWGEVAELRRRDIDPDCSIIHVDRAVTHRKGKCVVGPPKSGKMRHVAVPPHVLPDLRDHLAHNVESWPDALLFPAVRSCHFNDRTFRDIFAAALESVGITQAVRIQDLRHFAGTQAARVGNLVETMARLGHSTVKASLIYQAVASGRDREVADDLSKLAQEAENTG